MRIVNQFYQFPGKCFFTGSSDNSRPILDTEHYVEGRGLIYIGGAFLEEAARLAGFVPAAELEELQVERDALLEEVIELREITAADGPQVVLAAQRAVDDLAAALQLDVVEMDDEAVNA